MLFWGAIGTGVILAGVALYAYLRGQRTPEVLGTQMSEEWLRHITHLLAKPGAGEGTYYERER